MSKNTLLYILLACLMAIGTWLRIGGIIDGSFSFTYDVGRDMLAAQDIVFGHNLTLIGPTTGLEGLFYGPWWYYLLGIPFFFSGGDPKGVVLFIAILGILCIPLAFFIGKKMGSMFYGIAAAAIISVSPHFIETSSQIWSPNVIPILMLLTIFFLHDVIAQKRVRAVTWIILGFCIALIAEMEIFFGLLFAIALITTLAIFLKRKLLTKNFLFFFAGFFLIQLPRILFELRHSFLMTKKVFSAMTSNSSNSFISSFLERRNFVEIQSRFDELWSHTITNNHHEIGLLVFGVFLIVAFLYFRKAKRFEKFIILLTFVTIVTLVAVFLFFSEGLWLHYLVGIPTLLVLSVTVFFRLLQEHFPKQVVAYILLFAIVLLNLDPIKRFEESKMPLWEGNEAVYRNQIQVVDYIYNQAGDKEFKYDLYTPPVRDHTYKYLFSWYGKRTYNKLPNNEDAELFFLIVEPDFDYYHRRLDWLAKKEPDGKFVKKEHVIGNIVVHTKVIGED